MANFRTQSVQDQHLGGSSSRMKSPLDATGKTNSAPAGPSHDFQETLFYDVLCFHFFFWYGCWLTSWPKNAKKSSINLKPVCSKFCTSNIRMHPCNHSFKMSQNMIALNSWQREIQLAQEGWIETWHQRKNYKNIYRYSTNPNVLSHFKWHSVQAYACLHASWSMANFRTRSELCRTSISWWLEHAVQISVGCYSKDKFCSGQPYDFQETQFPYFPFNLDVGWGHGQRMPKNQASTWSPFAQSFVRPTSEQSQDVQIILLGVSISNDLHSRKLAQKPQNGDLENKFPSTAVIFRFQPFQGCRFGRWSRVHTSDQRSPPQTPRPWKPPTKLSCFHDRLAPSLSTNYVQIQSNPYKFI